MPEVSLSENIPTCPTFSEHAPHEPMTSIYETANKAHQSELPPLKKWCHEQTERNLAVKIKLVSSDEKIDGDLPVRRRPVVSSIERIVQNEVVASTDYDECPICTKPLMIDSNQHNLICTRCGFIQEFPDPTGVLQSVPYMNLEKRTTLLSHFRMKKFATYMSTVLVRQKSVVPIHVLIEVCKLTTERYGLKKASEMTFMYVANVLETTEKLKKFVDYKVQIYCRITGSSIPRITPSQEEALVVLYLAIQQPFDRLKKDRRSTFFSITFVMYMLCSFLGYRHMLQFIYIKKTRMKLENQIALLRLIFRDLGWSPFPKLPHVDGEHPRRIV